MERGQDEVARQGGLDRDVGRLAVADLADEHDVGVLAQYRAQNTGEGKPLRDVHVALVDAWELVFDGVFSRHYVDVGLVEVLEARVQRRRLARAGRACHEDDAVRLVYGEFHRLVGVFVKPKRCQPWREIRLVENSHHDLFAVDGREYRDADVDLLLHRLDLEAAVLRAAALGDVEVRENLDARHDGVVEGLRRRGTVHKLAVDAVPEARRLFHRLEVYVGRLCLEGFDHDRVDHADDRRLARRVERRVKGVGVLVFAGGHLDVAVVALHDVLHRKGGVRRILLALEPLEGVV